MIKKIIFVHRKFPYGGAEKITIEVANYLSTVGWDVAVVAEEFLPEYFSDEIPMCFSLKAIPKDRQSKNERNFWLANLINAEKVDFVVCKDEWTIDIAYIKKNTKAKVIFHLHSVPYWEEITLFSDMVKTYSKRKNLFLRWNFTLRKNAYKKKISLSVRDYYKKLLNSVDGLVTLCNGYKEILDKDTAGVFTEKIFPIYNPCITESTLSSFHNKEVLYVGHLSFIPKKIDRLLRIWSLSQDYIPEWTLRIIGDGPDKKELETMSLQLGLKNIIFNGWEKNVKSFYQTASIICMTSEFEGWPLALAEAQCYGVIPIAFDVCAGIHEILEPNGVNGILIDQEDENLFASELVRLANDVNLQQKIRKNVVKKAESYSLEKMGKSWSDMLCIIQND